MNPTTRDYLLAILHTLFVAPVKALWRSPLPEVLVVLWGLGAVLAFIIWGAATAVCYDGCSPADLEVRSLSALIWALMAAPVLPVMAVNLYRIAGEAFRREIYIRTSLREAREAKAKARAGNEKR